MDNEKKLVLEDETFEDARASFNRILQKLFRSMEDTGATDGSITMKMEITMVQEFIPNFDPDVDGETRKIQKPSFKHKVSSVINVKDEVSGSKNPEMELVWDEDQQLYVLQYVANTQQRSFFDKDFQETAGTRENQENGIETSPERDYLGVAQIEGPVADEGALPDNSQSDGNCDGNDDGNVVDADFREVDSSGETADTDQGQEPDQEPETPDAENEPETVELDESGGKRGRRIWLYFTFCHM